MKHYFKLILLSLLSLTCLSNAEETTVQKRLEEIGKEFDKLTKEKRDDFMKLKQKASEARVNNKFFTCIIAIEDAQQVFKGDLDLVWLHGICLAEIQDIDSAIEKYNEVLEVNPLHIPSLMNLVEINFFAGRYEEALKHIERVNALLNSSVNTTLPLLEFKYLICLTKLADTDPIYKEKMVKLGERFNYMDDNPYYYYSKALADFDAGNKQDGLIWILKAYLIFEDPQLIEIWNKALVDTGFIGAHEILFSKQEQE